MPTSPEDPAGAYDRWAAVYDDDRNATRDLDAAVLRAAGLQLEGRDVLELGCGTGKNTGWLAGLARTVLALDLSTGMLARARARITAASVRFVEHDVRTRWPAADASVDAVVGNLVLEHVADLAPVFREAARVLRPGGTLWLAELHPERQRRGGQAHFRDPATGETVYVVAHRHDVSDYVNGGLDAGLELRHLGEPIEAEAPAGAPPRLLTLRFARP